MTRLPSAEEFIEKLMRTGEGEDSFELIRTRDRIVLEAAIEMVEGYLITWPADVSFVQDIKRHAAVNIIGQLRALKAQP